ncbi:DNA-processing protein DprA [Agrobacterium pusense]|uniref:DNA-processing protein DprA n=1 Tax=Agrobacterium pusense TaxID=648995 RepID=UPI000887584E|nr:DNA-processing protein DprA [Agrobacterium pusense]WKD47142.1 DNA-protecting protein DprA [Agrobacterium pusense]SDF16200.1 DNA processing protein [Agrobacterium pusense]
MLGDVSVPHALGSSGAKASRGSGYISPSHIQEWHLSELLSLAKRTINEDQKSLFSRPEERDPLIYCAGNIELLTKPCISVIGARSVSDEGRARASRVAKELAKAGVVVTSGLAKGVDTSAHRGAIDVGGSTMAVIGTPLDKVYPAENSSLQQTIYSKHLLISQFRRGERTFQSDFPKRNRLMAALSDGSVIVEASDTSGTLHQAAECIRLGRWLFIMQSVVNNDKLSWPARFLNNPRTVVLSKIEDVLTRI